MLPLTTSADYLAGRCGGFDGETTCPKPRGHVGPCRFHDPSGSGRWIEKDADGDEVRRGPLHDGRWMGESPLRRRPHPCEFDGGGATHRDVCEACGLVRASYVHHVAELAAGRDWQAWNGGKPLPGGPDASAEATLGGLLGPRPPMPMPTPFDADQPRVTAPRGGFQYRESARSRPPSCGEQAPQGLGLPGTFRELCALAVGHGGLHRADSGMEWRRICEAGGSERCVLPAEHTGRHRAAEVDPLPDAEAGATMRTGRKVGRTLYLTTAGDPDGVLIGVVDTPELAAEVARRWNATGELAPKPPAGRYDDDPVFLRRNADGTA
jgi:hypothetical protein